MFKKPIPDTYKVVEALSLDGLARSVSEHMQQGWETVGGVSTFSEQRSVEGQDGFRKTKARVFIQAIAI